MSTIIEVSEIILAPVSVVWKFYSIDHVANHPRWDPDMKLEQLTEGSLGVGSEIRRLNTHSGTPVEGRMRITRFEENKEFAVVIEDRGMDTVGRVFFEDLGDGRTKLTISAEFMNIDADMANRLREMMKRSPRNIKKLIEEGHL